MFSSHWRQSALLRSLYWIFIWYMITFTSIWFEVNYICTMYECNRTCARKSLSGLWKMVLTLENYRIMLWKLQLIRWQSIRQSLMQADSSDDTNSMERHYAFNQCRVLVYGSFSESEIELHFWPVTRRSSFQYFIKK